MPRILVPIDNESKAEHFRRICQFRVNSILRRLESMQSFRGREYEYSETDLNNMFRAIEDELEELRVVLYTKIKERNGSRFVI